MRAIAPPVQAKAACDPTKRVRKPWLYRLAQRCRRYLFEERSREKTSFLASMIFHAAMIFLLAWLSMLIPSKLKPSLVLSLEDSSQAGIAPFEIISGAAEPSASESIDELPIDVTIVSFKPTQEELISISDLEPTHFKLDQLSVSLDAIGKQMAKSSDAESIERKGKTDVLFVSGSLDGRLEANRAALAMKNGGTKDSEAAVDAALIWLSKHQAYDGSWSTLMNDAPCNGRCSHGSSEIHAPKRIAATGLALLCFLGAGHTHRVGEYRTEVYKALMFLSEAMKRGDPTPRDPRVPGRFLRDEDRYEMYEHGIALLALCEAYQMTQDKMLKRCCQDGIDFLNIAQCFDGSWGYRPRDTGDLSIVGWQMMALKSAHASGLKVRHEVIRKVDGFLDSQQSGYRGAFYGYRSRNREPCTTAIGNLIRLYRSYPVDDPRIIEAADYIADLGPSTDGVYYDYYATQLLFLIQHPQWPTGIKGCGTTSSKHNRRPITSKGAGSSRTSTSI